MNTGARMRCARIRRSAGIQNSLGIMAASNRSGDVWSEPIVRRATRPDRSRASSRRRTSLSRITVFSGGVERTLKVVEYSDRANLHFTAYISPAVIRDSEVRRRLEALERSGRLALRTIGSNHTSPEQFDAAMIPSEFWIPALRRIRAERIRAPIFIEFHQLPYIGTFDVLKTVGVDDPGVIDLVRFPFVSSKILGDGL